MNLKLLLITIIAGFIFINTGLAQTPKLNSRLLKNKDWGFLPNIGQLADGQGNALSDVKYYGHQGGVRLYCSANKISFVFAKVERSESNISEATGGSPDPFGANALPGLPGDTRQGNHENDKIIACRADMVLIGANPNPKIIASGEQAYYENYYLAKPTMQGITDVHTHKTLTYQNIYPHIDLVLHSKATGIKYEYVVHPGGSISDIRMQWYGLASAAITASGGIKYSMRLDDTKIDMQESTPYSYTRQGKVVSQFIQHGDQIGFTVGKYDLNETLTIDPDLEWGTYFGGSSAEVAFAIRVDASGNNYITGYTSSTSGIATTGSYKSINTTSYDVFIAKYNSYGGLLWATYYGGLGADYGYGLGLDASASIYISGYTTSQGLATAGAYITSPPGNGDAFVTKFNNAGSLQWATYFGGDQFENSQDLAIDNAGNVYIGGGTGSNSGIAMGNAYISSKSSTTESGFVAKFNSSGNPIWATYYGVDNTTLVQGVTTDASGNVFITGYTYSNNIASSGAYQTKSGGGLDAFVASFSTKGALLWSTYFGGSGTEESSKLSTDASGNVYMLGYSTSTGLASSGAYQTQSYPQNYDVYLTSFSGAGALKWCTYFGGKDIDVSMGICTYRDKYVYICGYTNDSFNIASKGAYQTTYSGQYDAFVAKFKTNGSLVWSTYYGGEQADIAYSVCTDSFDNAFITGYTDSKNGISNSAGHQIQNAGNEDVFVAKFSNPYPNNAGIDSIKSPAPQKCEGNADVVVSFKNYGTKALTSLTIGWGVNGLAQKVYHWTGSLAPGASTSIALGSKLLPAGTYIISAYTSMPNGIFDSIPENDTLKLKFKSNPLPSTAWSVTNSGPNYYFHVLDSSLTKFYYLWQFDDGFHYYGHSFTHAFPEKKTYKLLLITTNLFACTNEHDSSIIVTTTGIAPERETDTYNIHIFPSPFRDRTTIHFNIPEANTVKINIFDVLGNTLYSSPTKQYKAGYNEIEINSADISLAAGTYFLGITIADKMMMKKVVVMGR